MNARPLLVLLLAGFVIAVSARSAETPTALFQPATANSAPASVSAPPATAVATPPTPELATAATPAEDEQPSEAEQALQALVTRQKALFAQAEKAGTDLDENNFRTQLQQLANDYDDYLKRHKDYGPAYAAYGMMLGKISMRKESALMYLKANDLFAVADGKPGANTAAFIHTWALVKNQLGNYVAEEGKPLEAVNYFLAATDLAPNEPLYHYQLGTLLHEARDDFLASENWTRAALDKAMQRAFQRAAELAPGRIEFAYRYAESFYDLEKPDWDAALKAWAAVEDKATTDLERQTMRLHAANVLIKQQRFDHAHALLDTVTEASLQAQKQKLADQLAPLSKPAPAAVPDTAASPPAVSPSVTVP